MAEHLKLVSRAQRTTRSRVDTIRLRAIFVRRIEVEYGTKIKMPLPDWATNSGGGRT